MASATALAAAANVTAIVDDGRVMQAKTLFSGKRWTLAIRWLMMMMIVYVPLLDSVQTSSHSQDEDIWTDSQRI